MRGHIGTAAVAAALAALTMGVGTAGAADANVIASYDTPSTPGNVRYAFGAAWVDAPAANSLLRITPGAAAPTTTRLPGRIVDFTEGFGKMWVLWRQGARHYLAAVNPSSGRVIGSANRTMVPGRPEAVRAGARGVWTSALGQNFRKRTTLARVAPSTRKVTRRSWPTPADFFVEKGLVWSFEGLKLVKRAPATLRTRGSVRAFSGFNDVTYGLGNFWTSSLGPTADGGVTKISPKAGRGNVVYEFSGSVNDAGGIVTGGGSIWVLWQGDEESGGGPWSLAGFTPSGSSTQVVETPVSVSGQPNVAYGAGSLWVTDEGGKRLVRISPPS